MHKAFVDTSVILRILFADAAMAFWGLEKGFAIVFTYDEKDFKRIDELEVRKP